MRQLTLTDGWRSPLGTKGHQKNRLSENKKDVCGRNKKKVLPQLSEDGIEHATLRSNFCQEKKMNAEQPYSTLRVLRICEVQQVTGIRSRTGVYQRLDPKSRYYDPEFPRPFKIGRAAIGWMQEDVVRWLVGRRLARQ